MDETHMQHGRDWSGEDLTGWWASEKLDGCRAYWDGQTMWTRSGRPMKLPPEIEREMPYLVPLDGEVYAGPGLRRLAEAAVKRDKWAPGVRFMVFDRPGLDLPWLGRLAVAASLLKGERVKAVGHVEVRSMAHVRELYQGVKAQGGEGLMLVNPAARHYHRCRTGNLLKVKRYPGAWWQRLLAA